MKYSKNPKLAKDFLRWMHKHGELRKWFTTRRATAWAPPTRGRTTRCGASSTSRSRCSGPPARNTRLFGYAGPSTAKATEAFSKYIVTDMYAKAVQGMKAEDAVKWAEGELKKIYEA